jgi:hypothetical protein
MHGKKVTPPDWFYFGCFQQSGHYVFGRGMRSVYGTIYEKLSNCDGLLPPRESADGYVATISRLGAWGLTALAFWDYTVDKRGGSNSVFFAPSLTISADELIAGAKAHFPQVWARLPEIRLHQSAVEECRALAK